jgi:hypothetical protein
MNYEKRPDLDACEFASHFRLPCRMERDAAVTAAFLPLS